MLCEYLSIGYDWCMIAHLKGNVVELKETSVVISAGGVGYRVFISPHTSISIGEMKEKSVSLFTHLFVREHSMDLYGFIEQEEIDFFEMLITVSGVGPKSALAILSLTDVLGLKRAIVSRDIAYLTKVSGIGKKNAQKIIIELEEKVGVLEELMVGAKGSDTDLIEALTSLGYTTREARDAIKNIPRKSEGTTERLKEALKQLGGK